MVAGDLGADVIKVESPAGDPVRELAPPRFGDDATYYLAVNRHRRNVVANLKEAGDFEKVSKLVRQADIVIENYLPSQIESLRIEVLRALNPNAVWVSVTPAATGGPLAAEPSFDLLAQAQSGLMGVTGEAGGEPTKVGSPIADVVTGLYAAVGMLASLYAREIGKPQRRVEAPLLESTMSALVNQAQGYLATGIAPQRLGNDHPSIAPYGPVRTADGYVLLAVGTDGQFQKLVSVVGHEQLASDLYRTNDGRVRARAQLRALLDDIFSHATTDEWLERLRGSGVPCGPIADVARAFADPQITTGDFVEVTDAPHGQIRQMASPLRLNGERLHIRRGPRGLGEDSKEIFED
jgi:crotonobetainyl-CoA:carnitine CoA-transferase CaiB-like acyl-CoA transferase